MKTSIVMATYNGEKYLIEQLNSLLSQSLPADEVIFCDDGSKDNTVSMLQEYIADNHLETTWKLVINEKNLGYAGNFFKALKMAHGDYIFFCDQDDIWCNDKLEETVKVMDNNPQIKLLCSDFEPFSCAEQAPKVPKMMSERMKYDGSVEKIEFNRKNIYIASIGCVMCVRKSFRDQIVPFWVPGWAHDDYVWKTAQCVDGCYFYHKALIKRRLHENNVSMQKKHGKAVRTKFLRELGEANAATLKFAQSVNLNEKKQRFLARTVKAAKLREELVGKRKLWNVFRLVGYWDCYQSKKSILMEPLIAIKS